MYCYMFQLYVIAGPACVGVLLATLGVRSSLPPSPPSPSAEEGSEAFLEGIKKVIIIRYTNVCPL